MSTEPHVEDPFATVPAVLLRSGLDRLEEGIAIFDSDLRLVYCNAPFRDLRSYPESVCGRGAHISDLYRHNALAGNYGTEDPQAAVARRTELARSRVARAFDQPLPDGCVLHVRYQPLDGGGLLFSYEDVTAKRGTEAALAGSHRRAAAVAEATTEGIYDWQIDAGEFHASPRLAELFGFQAGDINAKQWDWNSRVHPDDFERYRAALVESLKDDGVRYQCEYRVRNRAGDHLWVLDRGVVAERDADTRATRFIGAVLDITDRKAAEEKLRVSEERYALAVASVNEGIYDWDIASERIYFSDSVRRVLGLTPAELATPQDWGDRIHPEDYPGYRRALIAHLKGETPRFDHEMRYQRGDGSWGWARQHGLAIRDAQGRTCRMIGATGDISEQKKLAGEIESLRTRLLDAIEALTVGFVLFDAEDRLVMCNGVYREYFQELADMVTPGRTFEEIVRAAIARGMFPLAAGQEDAFLRGVLQRRLETGTREQHMSSGQWLQVSDHRTSEGGLVAVYTDISELKARQAEIIQAKERAELALDQLTRAQSSLVHAEKMAALGQLTAGIAHEIKNPLNFINNFAKTSRELLDELGEVLAPAMEALEADARDEAQDLFETLGDDMATIREHGQRADRIVKGMLMHSRGDASQRGPADLNALLDESLNLAYHGQRASVEGFNTALERDLDPGVGTLDVVAQDLSRVFVNLLGNAFYAVKKRQDAGESGYAPEVRVATRRLAPDAVEIRIRDNGTGIPAAALEKLFSPFFTTKPPGEGTGLGLSISRDVVVSQHGGSIRVDSQEGSHTEFVIELPGGAPPGDPSRPQHRGD